MQAHPGAMCASCRINPHCCHVAAAVAAQLLASFETRYRGLTARHSNLRLQDSLLSGVVVLTAQLWLPAGACTVYVASDTSQQSMAI